jgi:hypothetical protein
MHSTRKSDRPKHDCPTACVFFQKYSSPTYEPMCFQISEHFESITQIFYLFKNTPVQNYEPCNDKIQGLSAGTRNDYINVLFNICLEQ